MKGMAIIAVLLGVLGSAANAQSAIAVTEASNFTMAMNSATIKRWVETSAANRQRTAEVDKATVKTMEEVSLELDQQLENKMTQELDYAMQ